jgi:hypothetical protein
MNPIAIIVAFERKYKTKPGQVIQKTISKNEIIN